MTPPILIASAFLLSLAMNFTSVRAAELAELNIRIHDDSQVSIGRHPPVKFADFPSQLKQVVAKSPSSDFLVDCDDDVCCDELNYVSVT